MKEKHKGDKGVGLGKIGSGRLYPMSKRKRKKGKRDLYMFNRDCDAFGTLLGDVIKSTFK